MRQGPDCCLCAATIIANLGTNRCSALSAESFKRLGIKKAKKNARLESVTTSHMLLQCVSRHDGDVRHGTRRQSGARRTCGIDWELHKAASAQLQTRIPKIPQLGSYIAWQLTNDIHSTRISRSLCTLMHTSSIFSQADVNVPSYPYVEEVILLTRPIEKFNLKQEPCSKVYENSIPIGTFNDIRRLLQCVISSSYVCCATVHRGLQVRA